MACFGRLLEHTYNQKQGQKRLKIARFPQFLADFLYDFRARTRQDGACWKATDLNGSMLPFSLWGVENFKNLLLFTLTSIFLLSVLPCSILVVRTTTKELTPVESQIVGLVNGTRIYDYDLELERIAYNHTLSNYSFRSAGSSGANATADWIAEQFKSFGLETHNESYEFTNWNVLSKPTLITDDDGNFSTANDQTIIDSFQSLHYSWPTLQGGAFADLVVLPLPPAADIGQIGMNPINLTAWNAIDTTDKIVLVGREVRLPNSWQETFKNKLIVQPPSAVVHTWWYDWMSWLPPVYYSADGRPGRTFGPYFWDLEIPVGFVDYEDGLWIRNREVNLNVSAGTEIEAVISTGSQFNLIGKLRGSVYPDKYVIICAHRDTVMCSGFCDNGAGTAGIVELARVFSEANKTGLLDPRYTILFILFDGEELGLAGSINYVMQHKSEMADIVAVVNIDVPGSDYLDISATDPDPATGLDLDELVLKAARDLGIAAESSGEHGGSDDIPFIDPATGEWYCSFFWNLSAGIEDAHPVESSLTISSHPTFYADKWSTGTPGWMHTSYDNSTSTTSLNWVETSELENQLKVAALSIARAVAPLVSDVNRDGVVDMKDIGYVARRFGIDPTSSLWDPKTDVVKDAKIDMKDIGLVARHFGEHYP